MNKVDKIFIMQKNKYFSIKRNKYLANKQYLNVGKVLKIFFTN